jgi:hypothetical protein
MNTDEITKPQKKKISLMEDRQSKTTKPQKKNSKKRKRSNQNQKKELPKKSLQPSYIIQLAPANSLFHYYVFQPFFFYGCVSACRPSSHFSSFITFFIQFTFVLHNSVAP